MTKYTINELANSKGVSPLVREALLQMEAELKATNRQVEILSDVLAESRREVAPKDEALDLALETLESERDKYLEWGDEDGAPDDVYEAITAIKQARSTPVQEPDLIARLKHPEDHYEFTDPKKANAVLMSLCQEAADALAAPVLEHEPENEPHVSLASVQDDAHYKGVVEGVQKLFDDKRAQPAPVQEPVAWKWHQAPVKTSWGNDMVVADLAIDKDHTVSVYCERDQKARVEAMFTTPPAAQRQWVGLDNEQKQWIEETEWTTDELVAWIETKLKEKNT